MTATLYIAAKAPRPGLTKTRLSRAIGADAAVALYCGFLRDLAARFADAPFGVVWFITPADGWPEIAPLVTLPGREPRVLAQVEGDWTARQRAMFRWAAEQGDEKAMVLASDSPHTTVAMIAAGFRALDEHDLVIGPVHDGGYYILGMRGWHDVLREVTMSTATVVQDIKDAAARLGLTIAEVETTFDIDEAADLDHLRAVAFARDDLPATRAALEVADGGQ